MQQIGLIIIFGAHCICLHLLGGTGYTPDHDNAMTSSSNLASNIPSNVVRKSLKPQSPQSQ